MKYLIHEGSNSFSIAGLSESSHVDDTDYGHFSFIVYNLEFNEFKEAVNKLYKLSLDLDLYNKQSIIELGYKHNYRLCYQSGVVSISRDNIKILYHASLCALYTAVNQ